MSVPIVFAPALHAFFSVAAYVAVGLLDLWLVFGNGVLQQAPDLLRTQLIELPGQFEHAAPDMLIGQRLTQQFDRKNNELTEDR